MKWFRAWIRADSRQSERRQRRNRNRLYRPALESLEDRTLPTAGLLDGSFNSPNGYVLFNDLAPNSATSLAIQQDGRIVASIGTAVARLNVDGTPDSTFATNGLFGLGALGTSSAVAIQSDGKIVVAGSNSGDFEVIRLNADGSLDASFANNGAGRFSFSTGIDNAYAVALQSDGKIVVAGSANTSNLGGTIGLMRLDGSGLLDNSFGTGGFVTNRASGTSGRANGIAIQQDGKILIAGLNVFPNYCSLVRFNANGTLDASFGSSGEILETPGSLGDGNTGVAVRSDGTIVTSASLFNGGEIFAYNPDGTPEKAFGDYINGQRTSTVSTPYRLNGIALEADGKLIVYGATQGSGQPGAFAISRYAAVGDLDTSFGSNQGNTYLSFPNNANIGAARAVVLQRDGKIVVAGGEQPAGAFMTPAVARLTGEGQPIANDDNTTVAENTDTPIDVLANDSDSDDTPIDPVTVTIIASPSHGVAAVNQVTGVVGYSPDRNFVGSDSFSYTVDDTAGLISNIATVTIAVGVPLSPGVTLIAHGFGDNTLGWVDAMAQAIAQRMPSPALTSVWTVRVTDSSPLPDIFHQLTVSAILDSGPRDRFAANSNGETIIKLDWSSLAGSINLSSVLNPYSTTEVASAVATVLLTDIEAGRSWVDMPLHLIGHSRGGSLVGELAKDLGEKGVWVDQVTTLDPHPVDGTHYVLPTVLEPNWHDASMKSWNNVSFWDNYWENQTQFPYGETVAGAHSVYEVYPVDGSGYQGPFGDHSDVHLWYHGTIDTSPTASDGAYSVSQGWYYPGQGPRDQIGFYYSSVVGGIRPADGLWSAEGRQSITDIGPEVWPNIVNLTMDTPDQRIGAGGTISVTFSYQDYANGATITFYLDSDKNPYDGCQIAYPVPVSWAATGADPSEQHVQIQTDASIPLGSYFVFAKISDGTHTRFFYAPGSVTIATTTTLVSSPNPSTFGQNLTFTATVNVASATPTGTVQFFDDSTILHISPLIAGIATFTTSTLGAGSHGITARYSGDSNFAPSTSSVLIQEVDQAPAIASTNATTFTVGTAGIFTVTATGFPAPTLSESNTDALPAGVTFDAASGLLSGTPMGGSTGSYTLHLMAANGVGSDATQTFTLTVDAAAPAGISPTAGNNQNTPVNRAFADALQVTVKDAFGDLVSGASVTFTAPATGAGGSFSNGSNSIVVTTDTSGVASATFTANSLTGSYGVMATISGVIPTSFSMTNTLVPATIKVQAGNGQKKTVNTAFGTALQAKVTDAKGHPVVGISVTFTAPASGAGGTFSNGSASITVTTNSQGVASVAFTANTIAGSYSVKAAAAGLTTQVSFNLTNTAGAAAAIAVTGGNNQSTAIGTAFASPLHVTVTDQYGNPVSSSVKVTFTAPTSGASGTFGGKTTTSVSTSSGVARAKLTANKTKGDYEVIASFVDANGITHDATFMLTNI
jgi:uncharacterized delta-60 repeat protein